MKESPYVTLRVAPTAELPDVTKAYYDLAKIWHPDKADPDIRSKATSHVVFTWIAEAYDVIKNHRDIYNKEGWKGYFLQKGYSDWIGQPIWDVNIGQAIRTAVTAAERQASQEQAEREAAEREAAEREAAEREAAEREAAEREAAKREAAKREAAKREAAKREAAKSEAAKGEAAKREAAKREAAKREAAEREAAKREAAERETAQRNPKPTQAPKSADEEGIEVIFVESGSDGDSDGESDQSEEEAEELKILRLKLKKLEYELNNEKKMNLEFMATQKSKDEELTKLKSENAELVRKLYTAEEIKDEALKWKANERDILTRERQLLLDEANDFRKQAYEEMSLAQKITKDLTEERQKSRNDRQKVEHNNKRDRDAVQDEEGVSEPKSKRRKKTHVRHWCSQCDKPFKTAKILRRHVLDHKNPSLPCTICDKSFKRADVLKTHIKNQHST